MIPIRTREISDREIAKIVPGGVLPSDKRHIHANDGSCSRCRQQPPVWPKPLLLYWPHGVLLIYCQECLQADEPREF